MWATALVTGFWGTSAGGGDVRAVRLVGTVGAGALATGGGALVGRAEPGGDEATALVTARARFGHHSLDEVGRGNRFVPATGGPARWPSPVV